LKQVGDSNAIQFSWSRPIRAQSRRIVSLISNSFANKSAYGNHATQQSKNTTDPHDDAVVVRLNTDKF